MESRFEFADRKDVLIIKKMIKNKFPLLKGMTFEVIYDFKKRMSGGKYVFARVKKANDEIRLFTEKDERPNGCDVVIFIDHTLFKDIEKKDKKRIIYHELCHIQPSEKGGFDVIPHDFEGFYSEIEENKDDPEWKERLATLVHDLYKENEE